MLSIMPFPNPEEPRKNAGLAKHGGSVTKRKE